MKDALEAVDDIVTMAGQLGMSRERCDRLYDTLRGWVLAPVPDIDSPVWDWLLGPPTEEQLDYWRARRDEA